MRRRDDEEVGWRGGGMEEGGEVVEAIFCFCWHLSSCSSPSSSSDAYIPSNSSMLFMRLLCLWFESVILV